jgi:hypothetical protein
MEIGLWEQTRAEWIKQGMPEDATEDGLLFGGNEFFGMDGVDWIDIETVLPYPFMEEEVIEEDERVVVFKDEIGRIRKRLKEGFVGETSMSMDQYLSFPVTDRKSFLSYSKGFKGNLIERYPDNWDKVKREASGTSKPLSLFPPRVIFGYYSMLREWMGTEALSCMFYDDPKLIHECLDFLTEYIVKLVKKALDEVDFDIVILHEDLCYKTGPLISPDVFKKFFLEHYKKYISLLKNHGVKLVFVDTDGNFEKLVPLFLESGLDGFAPLEVAAGMDPVYLRKKFGKSFSMWGGVDKRELAKSKKDIEAVIKHIDPIVEEGGYIPTVDHTVQPGVTYENFLYYLELKRKILN